MDKEKKFGYIPIVVGDLTYDPAKDIQPVDQFGFVDLRDAYVNACVPGDLVTDVSAYNGVEEPASLVGRSSDVFDALRKASYVKSAESSGAKLKGAATTSGETE